jgi:hypothetical protein
MERSGRLVVGALLVALGPALLASPPATAAKEEGPDERAAARLDAMANALSKATRLRATIDASWDVTQPTGEKIEFGETRVLTVRRPDRLRAETTRRDGTRRVFLFDGTQLAVFDADLKVYATESRPGTLDAALDHLTQDLHMRMPLRELFASDLAKTLAPLRRTARWVGAETVAGVATDHVVLRGDDTDLQVWIPSQGDPLPRRIVITYREEEGQPQFRANLTDWTLSPEVPDELFVFKPDENAEKIPFAAPGAATPSAATGPTPEGEGR